MKNVIIAKTKTKSIYANEPDFEIIYIYSDEYHKSICFDSSFENANRIFFEIGKTEYVDRFGDGIGFASMESYENAKKEGRIIENIK